MTYPIFARRETEASASQSRSAGKPAASTLRIGDPNDAYEQEADAVAAAVMSGHPAPSWSISNTKLGTVQRQPTGAGTRDRPAPKPSNHDETAKKPLITAYLGLKESPDTGQRLPTIESLFKAKPIRVLDRQLELKPLPSANAPSEAKKNEEPTPVQRKAEGGTPALDGAAASQIVHDALNSQGQPLDPRARSFFEAKFGYDLSNVRLHNDATAAQSAASVNAKAYTVGNNVVFGRGTGPTDTQLLAHELAHVVQQKSGSLLQRKPDPAKKFAAGQLVVAQVPFALMDKLGGAPDQKKVKQIAKSDLLRVEGDAPGSGGLACQVTVMANSSAPELDEKGATKTGVASPGWLTAAPAGAGGAAQKKGEAAPPSKAPTEYDPKIEVGTSSGLSDTGVPMDLRQPLEPGPDYNSDNAYIDNIAHAYYDLLTNRFELLHNDGTGFDLDADRITRAAKAGQRSAGGAFAGGLFFRNTENKKIYPVFLTAGTIPNIVACWNEIEKQAPEARNRLRDALIDVAISAHGVAKATISAGQKAAPASSTRLSASQAARRAFAKLEPEYAKRLGVGAGGVVHHARELQLLDKYPSAFTEEELNAFGNMRGIPAKYNNTMHLSGFRKFWNEAYEFIDNVTKERKLNPGTSEYNKFVREMVERYYRRIDEEFGHLFTDYGKVLK